MRIHPAVGALSALLGTLSTPFTPPAAAQDSCTSAPCSLQRADLLWFQKTPQAEAVWSPFGVSHSGAKPFADWIKKAKHTQTIPDFTNSLSLNCWEYVLYTGLRLGRLDLDSVKALYRRRAEGEKLSEIFGKAIGKATYTIKNSNVRLSWPSGIEPGDVVFMDEASHVVQLLGARDTTGKELVISFSPRPIWGDGSQERPVPSMRPEVTTLESLIEEMIELYPDVPTDWNNIELKLVRIP